VKKFLIGEYLAKIQARIWLSRALSSSFSSVGQVHKVHETTTLLLVTLPNIHQFKKKSLKLSNLVINNPTTP